MRTFDEYRDRYPHARMRRENGILELELHTDGSSLVWGDGPHTELGFAFADIAQDAENRVVILAGVGDAFCRRLDDSWVGAMTPAKWQKIYFHGHRLLLNLLDIEVPVVGLVNGPATVHAEIPLLSDIVVATKDAVLQDAPHFRFGTVPSDGVHVVWQQLLGMNRGRSFLLMADKIQPDEALRLGLYRDVLDDADAAWSKAREIAAYLAAKPDTVLRYSRYALTHRIKQELAAGLSYGLALEGLGGFESWPTE